jgi:hypothetical protein
MSYCRFRNTLIDLDDCFESIHDTSDLSEEEEIARIDLILLCRQIVDVAGDEVEEIG